MQSIPLGENHIRLKKNLLRSGSRKVLKPLKKQSVKLKN